MKTTVLIARILLGLMFLVFGLNGFLHFIPAPPIPGVAGDFLKAVAASHFSDFFFGVQVIAGVLLLINQFVPLALALLAAEIFNILAFHITMNPQGIGPGLLALILWIIVASRHWTAFGPLLTQKPLVR